MTGPAGGPVVELAPAKANLVLHVGRPRPGGLHPLCSLFASLELADRVEVAPSQGADSIACPGVEGPNLAAAALSAYRAAGGELPPLAVRIAKRIPVAAGLGGGSADAAAVLRAADRLAARPLGAARLRALAAGLGSDVPSQIEPAHALVTGTGERVEPIALPPAWLVLVPQVEGLATAAVYAEADRLRSTRDRLDPAAVRELAARARGPADLAAGLENDLEPAARSLRPQLAEVSAALRAAGALGTLVSGSGPTVLGVFAGEPAARRAAARFPAAIVTALRGARAPAADGG